MPDDNPIPYPELARIDEFTKTLALALERIFEEDAATDNAAGKQQPNKHKGDTQ